MHLNGNFGRVALGFLGIATCTMDMGMRTITLLVEKLTNRRVWRMSDSPRFLDELTVSSTPRGPQSIHAAIEVSPLKFVPSQTASNTRFLPIRASTGPLNEYPRSHTNSMFGGLFKSFPNLVKQSPMYTYLLSTRLPSRPMDVYPRRSPRAWTRQPYSVKP